MKVLVIRFSSIGDIVLTSPVIRCLDLQLKAEIHFLTKESFQDLIKYNPRISKIYTIKKNLSEVLEQLKNEQYDRIIDLHANIRSRLVRISLAVPSIAINKMTFEKYMFLIFRLKHTKLRHQVDKYFSNLGRLGIKNDGLGLEQFCKTKMSIIDSSIKRKNIVLSIGGSKVTKRIPADIVYQLCHMNRNLHFWIIGGDDVEKNKFENNIDNATMLIDELNLDDSSAIIRDSDLVVSGDSGMMHIAAAFQRPLVVMWGSTSSDLGFHPYLGTQEYLNYRSVELANLSCRPCSVYGKNTCPKGHMKCITKISVGQLNYAINELLS